MLYWLNVSQLERGFCTQLTRGTFSTCTIHLWRFPLVLLPFPSTMLGSQCYWWWQMGEGKSKPQKSPDLHQSLWIIFVFRANETACAKVPWPFQGLHLPRASLSQRQSLGPEREKGLVEFLIWAGSRLLYFSITENSPPGEAMKYGGNGRIWDKEARLVTPALSYHDCVIGVTLHSKLIIQNMSHLNLYLKCRGYSKVVCNEIQCVKDLCIL